MFTLVIGGAGSGKSAYAEALLCAAAPGRKWYLATMEPRDGESLARIEKHRRARAGRGFETVERYTDLAGLRLPERGGVLLDCLGNLAANELFSPGGAGNWNAALAALVSGTEHLMAQSEELVIVSNEVCLGGKDYAGATDRYLRLLAAAHRALAQRAGRVCEVCAGRAVYYKGRGPEA